MSEIECFETASNTTVINGEVIAVKKSPAVKNVPPLVDGCLLDWATKSGARVPLNIVAVCGKCNSYVDINNGKREKD